MNTVGLSLWYVGHVSGLELRNLITNWSNCLPWQHYEIADSDFWTSPDGAVVKSSASGLVGTGFTSLYRLQPRE